MIIFFRIWVLVMFLFTIGACGHLNPLETGSVSHSIDRRQVPVIVMESDLTKAGGALFRQAEQEARHLQRLVPQKEFCVIFNSLARRAGLSLRLEALRVGRGVYFLMKDGNVQKWLVAVSSEGELLVIKIKSHKKKKKSRGILL